MGLYVFKRVFLQFHWFHVEVLQAIDKNVGLDEEYIGVSISTNMVIMLKYIMHMYMTYMCMHAIDIKNIVDQAS